MLAWILFFFLSLPLFSLEISLSSAKEDFKNYSTLHLKDTTPFLCEEIKDDFKLVTKIICAFNKKPSVKIKNLQNNFFNIQNQIKNKTFFLIITPYEKLKLYPIVFNMIKDETFYGANVTVSKHWMIVGFKEKMPFIKKEISVDTSINFPFKHEKSKLPFVGSLDIKGNPVHIQRVGDVTDYLKIKKFYKEKKYDLCLELIDEVVDAYPNSLFNAELMYYKIRVFARLDDNDNVIAISKIFLREYSSDENIPEVLALIARGYSQIGFNTDADYFFDRLFNEHLDNEYSKWGYIYKAEMLEESGGISQAVKYYEKALNETQDIEIAVTAAYKLTKYYISNGNKQEASQYIVKILNARPEFFFENIESALMMMYKFADNEAYETAAKIAKALSDEMDKEHDEYEKLLKDRGMWLSKSKDKQLALDALNIYIKEFKYGVYEEIIAEAKDALFFDVNDGNFTTQLNAFNDLIDTYPHDSIGERAKYEKAKLLLENSMFRDVLAIEEDILELDSDIYEDNENIIYDSALGIMKLALKDKECKEVLHISNEYNITLSSDWDNGVYECSMMGGDFTLAKLITQRNLNVKDLDERKKWLHRHIKVDFNVGNYTEVIKASKDLIILLEDKDTEYNDVYRSVFDAHSRLKQNDKLLVSMAKIQEIYGSNYKDIERYVTVMNMGNNKKDDNIVITYGQEVQKIQQSSNSFAQSPFVEFTLYQAYVNKAKTQNALDVIKSLDSVDLSASNRARQKYLLATILSKLWRGEEADIAYEEAIKADPESAWAKLAKNAREK